MTINKLVLTTKIKLNPKLAFENVEYHLFRKLKKRFLKKCIKEGYVLDIIKINKRSNGMISKEHFDGFVVYDIIYEANVLTFDIDENIYGLTIDIIDKFGIHFSNDYINGYIESNLLPLNYIEQFKKGDKLNITTLMTKYNLYSDVINVLGKELHYYTLPKRYDLYKIISIKEVLPKVKVDIDIITSEESSPNPDLGYKSTSSLDKLLSGTDPKVLEFYQKLLNPFQLLERSDLGLLTFELYEVLDNTDIPFMVTPKSTKELTDSLGKYDSGLKVKKLKKFKNADLFISNVNIGDVISEIMGMLEHQNLGGSFIIRLGKTDITFYRSFVDLLSILNYYYMKIKFVITQCNGSIWLECTGLMVEYEKSDIGNLVHTKIERMTRQDYDSLFLTSIIDFNKKLSDKIYSKKNEIVNMISEYGTEDLSMSKGIFKNYADCQRGLMQSYIDNITK